MKPVLSTGLVLVNEYDGKDVLLLLGSILFVMKKTKYQRRVVI